MKANYLKIPVELAQHSLTEGFYKQAGTLLASKFIYSGNAHSSDKPVHAVSSATGYPLKSVYRYFRWLLNRNWIGKNKHGRYYFRGLDRIHEIENWTFARAAIMHHKDLKTFKAFMAGVVFASLAKTREGQQREQSISIRSNRSIPSAAPISLSLLEDTLEVSTSTAYRLRKLAHEHNYINNEQHLIEIINWTPNDLTELKKQDVQRLPVELLGYADKRITSIDRVRYKNNKLYLQEPNLVKPLLHLKSRKGLSKYEPCYGG